MTDMQRPCLLCCVGNAWRRDDGAGPALAERMRADLPAGVELMCEAADPGSLLAAWADRPGLVCVDAAAPAGHPGRVRRFAASIEGLAAIVRLGAIASSHGLGLAEALALAAALDRLPWRTVVYTLEAAELGHGKGLSAPVGQALPALERRVRHELRALRVAPKPPRGSEVT